MLKVAEHLYFLIHDQDSEEVSFFTQSFKTLEEASYWITELTQYDYTEHVDPVTDNLSFLFRHKSGYTLTVKGSHLHKLVEIADEDHPPSNDRALRRALFFWKKPKIEPLETTDKTPTPKPTPAKKTRPSKGQVTVGDIAKELGIPATKARSILRKAKISKPDQGWTFEAGTSLEAHIYDTIKKGI